MAILLFLTAFVLSGIAAYYSVIGLIAIFAASAIPVAIMGSSLEVAKLVVASWLYRFWNNIPLLMKTYFTFALVTLMLITSMGIFGFLSKAHLEQTSASQESVAQVERINSEILRQKDIVARAEAQITKLETSGTGNDAQVQRQIDAEQQRIDKAYERIQPAIDEQQRIIDSQGKLYQDELARIDQQLTTLQNYIDAGDKDNIKKAQAMIGARQDGSWGSRTAAKADEWKAERRAKRSELLTKIEQSTNNPQARAAREEIKRLRSTVERQIAESNNLINRLRTQIGKASTKNIDAEVDEQTVKIKAAYAEIDTLTKEKYQLETEYRKLEAEVGPLKFIAEFIYGESADKNMLEKAVRWLIIMLIFVFDPLAVLMLIAANLTEIKEGLWGRKVKGDNTDDRDDTGDTTKEDARAESSRTTDNGGDTSPGLVVATDGGVENEEDNRREDPKETEKVDTSLPQAQPSERVEASDEADQAVDTKTEETLVEQAAVETIIEIEKEETAEKSEDTPPSKKKKQNKKNLEDKSNKESEEQGFSPVSALVDDSTSNNSTTEDQIAKMIETGDTTGLEAIYKQIVKELGKQNRAKTTHWGPLKKN
jgi:cell division protein FtsB